ncbi:MAG: TetR/AcrR family transcriptional regulator [Crocinitomicaceae bacterium]|nr:TetR/AcrR family transcriptional regulator [Crocinitomicaceae bacterium]
MRLGIKSVTMDEMARQLGVSKKTLYQHVSDKNDLVMQCIHLNHAAEERVIEEILSTHTDAIDQLVAITSFVAKQLQMIHPSIIFDLNKYHPSVVKKMNCHKEEFVGGTIKSNLELGINQGVYRENLNADIIAMMHMATIDLLMSGSMQRASHMKPEEVYSEFVRYHIRGIASEKGLKHLHELVKKEPQLLAGL